MARKKTRRRSSTRRRRSPSAGRRRRSPVSRRGFAMLPAGTLRSTAVGTAGLVAAELLPAKLPGAFFRTDTGAMVGKGLVMLAGAMLVGKFVSKRDGAAFGVGAGISIGRDVAAMALSRVQGGGVSGVYRMNGPALLTSGLRDGLEGVYNVRSLAGMGADYRGQFVPQS